jgi:hypothetical protein
VQASVLSSGAYATGCYAFTFRKDFILNLSPHLMRIISFLFLFPGILNQCYSQSLKYDQIFGDDWKKALLYVSENREWMQPFLEKNNISYTEAVAVIFPELVRYSALRDKMETAVLKALYINLGETYANFSIGVFQIKPSFASFIREEYHSVKGGKSAITFRKSKSYDDQRDYRSEIVTDLEDPVKQMKYIAAFIQLCEKKFRVSRMNEHDRVIFMAAAYNCGINKDRKSIENMISRKFYNTKLIRTENYSYSDVSIYWYNQFKKQE